MEASTKNTVALILLAFLVVLVQSIPDEDVDAVVNKCLAENNITKDEYEILINQTSLETDNDKWDRKYKCYIHCLAKDMDILDNSGYVDVEKADELEELSADDREAFYKCKELHDEPIDHCEYAFNMFICLVENIDQ